MQAYSGFALRSGLISTSEAIRFARSRKLGTTDLEGLNEPVNRVEKKVEEAFIDQQSAGSDGAFRVEQDYRTTTLPEG